VWDLRSVRSGVARAVLVLAVIAAALGFAASAAGAKVLPIGSVHASTTAPTAGRPFTIVVRFRAGLDFVDAGWENFEISIVPAADTDARGWPRGGGVGQRVPIHRVAFGVFRGTATVRAPGDYVIVDNSSVAARVDRLEGVVNIAAGAPPVRIHVAAVAIPSKHARSWTASDRPVVAVAIGAAIGGGLLGLRRRRRRPAVASPQPGAPVDTDRVPVG
jgi:hypothetical protein